MLKRALSIGREVLLVSRDIILHTLLDLCLLGLFVALHLAYYGQ